MLRKDWEIINSMKIIVNMIIIDLLVSVKKINK